MVASAADSNGSSESQCKRYKLEDQLSDIQFIDCNTPEHTVNATGNGTGSSNNNTIFTSAQVHRPPLPEDDSEDDDGENELIGVRNSYPGPQYCYVKYDSPIKETRFSYPGTATSAKSSAKQQQQEQKMNVDEQQQQQKTSAKNGSTSLYERYLNELFFPSLI